MLERFFHSATWPPCGNRITQRGERCYRGQAQRRTCACLRTFKLYCGLTIYKMFLQEACLLLLLSFGTSTAIDPRPFYVFGNMANSLEDVDNFVARGANAVEADLEFASDGTAEEFYHGGLCGCGRDCEKSAQANTYLSYLRDSVNGTIPSEHMLNVIMSVSTTMDKEILSGGAGYLETGLKFFALPGPRRLRHQWIRVA
ncbi:hypothetical protein MRX96_032341 [Rhipicephalus microplus]